MSSKQAKFQCSMVILTHLQFVLSFFTVFRSLSNKIEKKYSKLMKFSFKLASINFIFSCSARPKQEDEIMFEIIKYEDIVKYGYT